MTKFCEPCGLTLSIDSYKSHILGKKHKLIETNLEQKKKLEETGLFIRGVPYNIKAAELRSRFGQFGDISKIEVYGSKAYLNYVDKISCDEALKHKHIINNKVLEVNRRKFISNSPGSSGVGHGQGQKRSFDNILKNAKPSQTKNNLDYNEVLNAISAPAPIIYQFSTLKSLLLAGNENCHSIMQKICYDLELAMKTVFSSCKLYPFGSMTTGLAFKDSDLDVFADLEINQSNCLLLEGTQNTAKKIFDKAKSCLYRRGDIFTNIVPIQGAKTPIIKFVHKASGISCDLSFRDAVGYCNSGLLRHYLQMNERFFELVFFVKYWSRMHQFCSTSKFSNFALCMLSLSFILSLKDSKGNKVVPPVQDLLNTADQNDPLYYVQGWRCAFNTSPITLDLPSTPNFTMPGLLKSFFEYVAQLPFETNVISVLTGELISRKIFEENPIELPEAYECYKTHIARNPIEVLCKPDECVVIHDPFKLNHNLTGRVTKEVLQSFTCACKAAAELCATAMDINQSQSTLLHQLLKPNQPLPNSAKHSPAKGSTGRGNVDSSKAVVSISSEMPADFQGNLMEKSTRFIATILEKLLYFKIEKTIVGDSVVESKVCKTDFAQDVHEENQTTVMICQGTKDVWNGRKKAQALLKLKGICFQNPLSFHDESCVSSHIAETNVAISNFHLECRLMCCKGKLCVQFYNLTEGKQGHFNSCMSFVKIVIGRWITEFSKNFLTDDKIILK
ncbi:poly(A) RNA polymerase, mitochondrial-like [Frankliniella occidentalis]|uniref:Poly(A) RNA polymerase, mitochondrial-like n=1 Tax=Frankliniella occidentalis TaxID=133901 RepID=A0A9C6UAZ4_FRAOC|nr:poly(A) RNA polymerase, mitochondrial-like [Frankliniella occidentalis]